MRAQLADCLKAADELDAMGISTSVADARFAKPLDTALVDRLATQHQLLVTVEEGSIGGFAAHVQQHLLESGLLDGGHAAIALPNQDRTVTCTLFWPYEGEASFGAVASGEQATGFFRAVVPDVVEDQALVRQDDLAAREFDERGAGFFRLRDLERLAHHFGNHVRVQQPRGILGNRAEHMLQIQHLV